MALFDLRLTLTRPSDDDVVWSWPVEADSMSSGLLGALIDRWQTAWTTFSTTSGFSPLTWTLIEAFPATGGPAVAVQAVTPPFTVGNGQPGPQEVAIVVSREVVLTRGQRPFGRLFLGPVAVGQMSRLIAASFRTSVTDFMAELHESWLVEDVECVVISRQVDGDPVAPFAREIVAYSTDDAWDTQRSRGSDPTTRTTVTL